MKRKKIGGISHMALQMAQQSAPVPKYHFPICPPKIPAGVIGKGGQSRALAMDGAPGGDIYENGFFTGAQLGTGFPGYAYLAELCTRPEFRAFALALSTETTRKWVKLNSKQTDGTKSADKIAIIENEMKRLNLRGTIRECVEQDCYFGRAQIFIDLGVDDEGLAEPFQLDHKSIKLGSLKSLRSVEAFWTTPTTYATLRPEKADFYRPDMWWMLGREVHANRLITIITRRLPDILKPPFNFGGMSLSQLAEPYVDNWLRMRESVSGIAFNFRTAILKTDMSAMLQGDDLGLQILKRAQLAKANQDNQGLWIVDREHEDMAQLNTPLGGLSDLQKQALEMLCIVTRIPPLILLGQSPSGLNASGEGELTQWYDWISAQQEAHWREPLELILSLIQLSNFGEIDPDIGFEFVPLYQMSDQEKADIRVKNSQVATGYINAGVLAPDEERQRLADDPDSGYNGIDIGRAIAAPGMEHPEGEEAPGMEHPEGEEDPAEDHSVSEAQHRAMEAAAHGKSTLGIPRNVGHEFVAHDKEIEWEEGKHPRAENGEFGSGGGSKDTHTQANHESKN